MPLDTIEQEICSVGWELALLAVMGRSRCSPKIPDHASCCSWDAVVLFGIKKRDIGAEISGVVLVVVDVKKYLKGEGKKGKAGEKGKGKGEAIALIYFMCDSC